MKTTANYKGVSGKISLYRSSIGSESTFQLSANELSLQATTFAKLSITNNFISVGGFSTNHNYASSRPGFTQITVNDGSTELITISTTRPSGLESCTTVVENLGATQARPFLFYLTDTATNTITQIGQVRNLIGERAEKEVCLSEKVGFQDNIWPLKSTNKLNNIEDLLQPVSNNSSSLNASDNNTCGVNFFNRMAINTLSSRLPTHPNAIVSFNELYTTALSKLAAPDSVFNQWLLLNDETLTRADFVKATAFLNKSETENKRLWVQSRYEAELNYLNFVTKKLDAKLVEFDFFNTEFPLQKETSFNDWLTQKGDGFFNFDKLVSKRTRMLIGSTSNATMKIESSSTSTAKFVTKYKPDIITSASVIEGNYPYFEDSELKAIQISGSENDLLILMPVNGQFDAVVSNLLTYIETVSSLLSPQDVKFILPNFSIRTNNKKVDQDSTELYQNASKLRPLYPLSIHSFDSISFNNGDLAFDSFALNALIAPSDNGGLGEYYGIPVMGYDELLLGYSSSDNSDNADATPFIYALIDRNTKLILSIGSVNSVNFLGFANKMQ